MLAIISPFFTCIPGNNLVDFKIPKWSILKPYFAAYGTSILPFSFKTLEISFFSNLPNSIPALYVEPQLNQL